MKRLGLIIGGLIVLLVTGLVAAPFLIPASQYKARIEAAAAENTSRAFKINGPLRFTFWPNVGLQAGDVTIANAPGGVAPLFASVGELDIGVAVLPLLKGDVEVKRLIVRKANLALEEDVGGKPNWAFSPKNAAASSGGKPMDLKQFGLGDVKIEDSAISYRDKLGKVQAISALNATASLKSLDEPFSANGDFIYNGDKTTLAVEAAKPRALMEKGQTPLKLSLTAPKLTMGLEGALDAATFAVAGKMDAKGPSLRQFSAWTGNPMGPGGGMGPFSATSDLKLEGEHIDLKNASFTLDAVKGHGDLAIVNTSGKVPYVSGAVSLDALDVNPYLAPAAAAGPGGAKGVDVKAPWGNTPLDMSSLKSINADLKLATGVLTFQKIKIDSSAIDVAIHDGVMKAGLNQMRLYGGVGTGSLTLDAQAKALKFANHLVVKGVNATPFLTDAMGFDKVDGQADMDLTIAGVGTTQQSLMDTLSGKGNFSFKNGAIKGVDLAQIATQVTSVLTGAAIGPNTKTTFGEMAASFTIANGVAHTNDGRVLNPIVNITAAGDLDLARQTIAMKVTPKVLKSPTVKGVSLAGVTVPFMVKGPWSKLSFSADMGDAVKEKLSGAIDKALGGKDLSSLLGNKGGQSGDPLGQLFKKKGN